MTDVLSGKTDKQFQLWDKVKNNDGRKLTVMLQLEDKVYVKEEVLPYDSKDLTIIETKFDQYSR